MAVLSGWPQSLQATHVTSPPPTSGNALSTFAFHPNAYVVGSRASQTQGCEGVGMYFGPGPLKLAGYSAGTPVTFTVSITLHDYTAGTAHFTAVLSDGMQSSTLTGTDTEFVGTDNTVYGLSIAELHWGWDNSGVGSYTGNATSYAGSLSYDGTGVWADDFSDGMLEETYGGGIEEGTDGLRFASDLRWEFTPEWAYNRRRSRAGAGMCYAPDGHLYAAIRSISWTGIRIYRSMNFGDSWTALADVATSNNRNQHIRAGRIVPLRTGGWRVYYQMNMGVYCEEWTNDFTTFRARSTVCATGFFVTAAPTWSGEQRVYLAVASNFGTKTWQPATWYGLVESSPHVWTGTIYVATSVDGQTNLSATALGDAAPTPIPELQALNWQENYLMYDTDSTGKIWALYEDSKGYGTISVHKSGGYRMFHGGTYQRTTSPAADRPTDFCVHPQGWHCLYTTTWLYDGYQTFYYQVYRDGWVHPRLKDTVGVLDWWLA